jgi:hypothetical protein
MADTAPTADAAEALTAAASTGPFVTIDRWVEGAGWRRASLLISDPAIVAGRVTHARTVIAGRAGIAPAEVTERIAASARSQRAIAPGAGAGRVSMTRGRPAGRAVIAPLMTG